MTKQMIYLHAVKLNEGSALALNGNYFVMRGWLEGFSVLDPDRVLVICDDVTKPLFEQDFPALRFISIGSRRNILTVDWSVAAHLRRLPKGIYFRPTGQLPLFPIKHKAICGVADLNFVDLPTGSGKRIYKWISYALSFLRSREVICISEFTRSRVTEVFHVPRNRLTVIPNGVESVYFDTPIKSLEERRPEFITFAHQPHKNLEMAIRIVLRLNEQGYRIHLKVVGVNKVVSEEMSSLREHPAYSEIVHELGRVSDKEKVDLYQNALGLIFMSRYEGFGLPVIEAMALGTPVIASTAASLPEVAGGNAFLHGVDDIEEATSSAISIIARSPGTQEKVARGLEWSGRFTWRNSVSRFLEMV